MSEEDDPEERRCESLQQNASVRKVPILSKILEKHASTYTAYHTLTDCFLGKLISLYGIGPDGPGTTAKPLLNGLSTKALHSELPAQHAVWSSYALQHCHVSYLVARVLDLPSEQHKLVISLAWSGVGLWDEFDSVVPVGPNIDKQIDMYLKMTAGIRRNCVSNPVKPTMLLRGLMRGYRRTLNWISVAEAPIWKYVL